MWLWDQGADRVCYKDKMENEVKISKIVGKEKAFSNLRDFHLHLWLFTMKTTIPRSHFFYYTIDLDTFLGFPLAEYVFTKVTSHWPNNNYLSD